MCLYRLRVPAYARPRQSAFRLCRNDQACAYQFDGYLRFRPAVRPRREDRLCFLNRMVAQSVAVKERIVEEDPKEHGIRKALNFGHTIGHAYESLSFKKDRPLLHSHTVAAGIVANLKPSNT